MANKDYSLNTNPSTAPPLPPNAATASNQIALAALIGDASVYGAVNGLAELIDNAVSNTANINGAIQALYHRPGFSEISSVAISAPDISTLITNEDGFFAANPSKFLVTKNSFYDAATLTYVTVMTFSNL